MTRRNNLTAGLEPERYELHEPVSFIFESDRRDFFKFLGAGIFVVCAASKTTAFQESGRARRASEDNLPQEIDAWLHIGEKGEITVFTGKVEVGQNIRTSLSQAVAEEMRVPIVSVRMVMGDTQIVPFDMGTFGSRTTPVMNLQLRRVSAAARDALIALAAKQWNTDPAHLTAADGKIIDPKSNRSATYAELVKGQQITQLLPAEDPLIPAVQWKIAGQAVPKVDGRDFVTGKHRYPSDYKLPDMLYGKVVRPSAFGATLVSVDTSAAEKMPGITLVHDGNFLAVAAPTTALAEKAAAALKPEWKAEPQPSSKELFEYLKKNQIPAEGRDSLHETGDVQKAFASTAHRLNSTFNIAYIAHAPLEPRAALAQWNGDHVTVWTGTQRPFGVRGELATAFHLPEEKVRVLMPDTGSGYGGKHTGEAALEAARLARAAKRPVKVAWTREEEFTWAYFRPAGLIEVSSAVDADGKITAWEFHNYNSGAAGIRTYYDIPNQRIEFHPVNSPLRQGSYRALAATANHFAREVHMDEIAATLKMDPLEFRLKNLQDQRLRAVFEQGGKQFGWNKPRAANRGFGVGGGFEKLGYMATFVEVSLKPETGEIKIERALTAFDCGAIVNPDGLRNQLTGANIMGLGGAIFEAIEFENGRIVNNVFSKYRVPRFRDVPPIDALLIDRKDQPSVGAGEAPILGIAPALANAIFAITRIPLHSLPMAPQLVSHGYQLG
ncbi:MAG TPA: molybdopterin cofactor-binding domain-containing protein [Candidatus Acidoferrum sp.]|nr:molybdopterin cofactor-binding domain-containing protein [Candidatus Acidoferrum sp.]